MTGYTALLRDVLRDEVAADESVICTTLVAECFSPASMAENVWIRQARQDLSLGIYGVYTGVPQRRWLGQANVRMPRGWCKSS